MNMAPLPSGLGFLQPLDFPHKLGICERLFGSRLRRLGICWVQTGGGIPWKLDLSNPTHRWIVYGKYEGAPFLNWARMFLSPSGVVVDSGANLGQMLLYLAQWVPQGKVLAFEPGEKAANWLEECLRQHPNLPVEVLRKALGTDAGPRRLKHAGPDYIHGAWSQITDEEGEKIDMVRLEDVLKARSLDHVDLWKLDVEGYEVLALKGAESLLKDRRIRALYIELAGENGARVRDYLAPFDYKAYSLDRCGRPIPMVKLPEHSNGLFLPEQGRMK